MNAVCFKGCSAWWCKHAVIRNLGGQCLFCKSSEVATELGEGSKMTLPPLSIARRIGQLAPQGLGNRPNCKYEQHIMHNITSHHITPCPWKIHQNIKSYIRWIKNSERKSGEKKSPRERNKITIVRVSKDSSKKTLMSISSPFSILLFFVWQTLRPTFWPGPHWV